MEIAEQNRNIISNNDYLHTEICNSFSMWPYKKNYPRPIILNNKYQICSIENNIKSWTCWQMSFGILYEASNICMALLVKSWKIISNFLPPIDRSISKSFFLSLLTPWKCCTQMLLERKCYNSITYINLAAIKSSSQLLKCNRADWQTSRSHNHFKTIL